MVMERADVHYIFRVAVVFHPPLVDLVDESPAATVDTLQNQLDVLQMIRRPRLRAGGGQELALYRSPSVKNAAIRAPVQQYTWRIKVHWTR